MSAISALIVQVVGRLTSREWLTDEHRRRRDRGATTMEWASLGATSVVVIIALTAALQLAGVEIIDWIKDQLIGGS